ncbi:Secreted protein [Candidatus Electrothrix laxa]
MKFCKSTLMVVLFFAVGSDIAAQDIHQPPSSTPLFKCGSGFTTYSVKSLDGVEGEGVRCVKIDNLKTVEGKYLSGVYWYGEGTWNGKKYRHIGCTYSRQGFQSFVTDIFGNGESYNNEVSSLLLTSSDKLNHIRVTGGGWNEEWVREPDGEANSYRSTLKKVTNCGDHLEKASVTKLDGSGSEDNGIRCIKRDPDSSTPDIWYGEGEWNGKPYRHFGFISEDTDKVLATAADLCNNSQYSCAQTAKNGLIITAEMDCWQKSKYRVSGDWNERWNGTKEYDCKIKLQ